MNSTPNPSEIRIIAGVNRQRKTLAAKNARSQRARRNGYRGPLTRAEMAARAARINSDKR